MRRMHVTLDLIPDWVPVAWYDWFFMRGSVHFHWALDASRRPVPQDVDEFHSFCVRTRARIRKDSLPARHWSYFYCFHRFGIWANCRETMLFCPSLVNLRQRDPRTMVKRADLTCVRACLLHLKNASIGQQSWIPHGWLVKLFKGQHSSERFEVLGGSCLRTWGPFRGAYKFKFPLQLWQILPIFDRCRLIRIGSVHLTRQARSTTEYLPIFLGTGFWFSVPSVNLPRSNDKMCGQAEKCFTASVESSNCRFCPIPLVHLPSRRTAQRGVRALLQFTVYRSPSQSLRTRVSLGFDPCSGLTRVLRLHHPLGKSINYHLNHKIRHPHIKMDSSKRF